MRLEKMMCRMLLRTCRVPGNREDMKWTFCKMLMMMMLMMMLLMMLMMMLMMMLLW